ncbi:hypothetical protein RclHR1_09460011 [Rhizophagus clarus]|uniref:BTB/POZ domain-containing protein n=1 Tax=Rhizophagus clarus TaxID=94130 RepID=A0A2Z6S4H5_9GLOM|nr:hypothetical protein RclHR1_09460011 [Rhizophagus clarus]GES90421.1 BTB/POZ domain-containing protein [Rhizophagus clarus]
MDYELYQNLANDLTHLLKDTNNCDVKIRVGKEQNIKEFMAHSYILSSRSIYFKKAFSEQWARKEDGFFISNQPNISPMVFEILINYIYSGTFSINNNKINLVDILIASDELELLEIYRQLEKRLLEDELLWKFPKDFITLYQYHDHFTNLYEIVLEFVCRNPKLIFDSKEFLEIEEDCLIHLLKCDNLKLEEIEIWDYLIKWGIKNTDSISNENLTKWTQMDFIELEKTLHNCIPYIRFSQMFPEVFNIIRKQYKSILPEGLVDDILQYFSDPNSKPSLKNLPLRVSVYPLDSKIINAKDVAIITSWIDKKKEIPYRIKDIPFKFELIYRASTERFSSYKFHEYCDNKGPTVVIIKVRNSGEIIGGYNPLDWRSIKSSNDRNQSYHKFEFYFDHKCKTSDSFIFSLTNRVIPVLSRVSSKEEAIIWCRNRGPCFGLQDLWVHQSSLERGRSKQNSYEKKIINKETFEMEEYEVFQIIDERHFLIRLIETLFNFIWEMIKEMFNSDFKREVRRATRRVRKEKNYVR